jgi:hypothetical protein
MVGMALKMLETCSSEHFAIHGVTVQKKTYVCVCVRERERETDGHEINALTSQHLSVYMTSGPRFEPETKEM